MLTVIIFLPLVGALAIALLPGRRADLIRLTAAIFSGLAFGLSVVLYLAFDPGRTGLQFVEKAAWVALPSVGVSYFVGVDGLNLPMVLLTTLLTLLAVL